MDIRHERVQSKLKRELGSKLITALKDKNIFEILLNSDGSIWFDGVFGMQKIENMPSEIAMNFLSTVASCVGFELNEQNPSLSAELQLELDGNLKNFRLQGLIPPIVSKPIFAIRKPALKIYSLDEYVESGILAQNQKDFIISAIENRQNILVAGGTGSGKTTFCNAILNEISAVNPKDRIILIEDTLELQCDSENYQNLKSSDFQTMNDLLRYSLRLRPDRIILGEVRGKEAHSMVKAWNTGHPGGMSTIHANDALSALMRLEQLILEAGVGISKTAIAEAINIIIFISRDSSVKAGRRIKEIIVVDGDKDGNYITRKINFAEKNKIIGG